MGREPATVYMKELLKKFLLIRTPLYYSAKYYRFK